MVDCLISIIVPVYNAEFYLRDCIESILAQTYRDIEVFLVDDGSTDNSGKICDEYKEKDRRIIVLHKTNGGQAEARNMALDLAKGKYIAFADSDDVLKDDYIEYMLTLALEKNADIVQCEYVKFWNDKELNNYTDHRYKGTYNMYTPKEALYEFAYQRKITPSPWCKLVKQEIWGDIRFPVGVGYEDYAIMYKVLGKALRIVYSPYCTYFYRIHNASTQHAEFSKKKKDRIIIADSFLKYIKENYPEIEQAARYRYCLAQFQYIMELPFNKKYFKDKEEVLSNIKKYRKSVLMDKNASTQMKIMLLASYLGVNVLMVLGRLYMKLTNR